MGFYLQIYLILLNYQDSKLIFATFFASLLWSPARSKTKKRSHANFLFAWLLVLFKVLYLHFRYSAYLFIRMSVKRPIYLLIGQSAVNTSTHDQSTILQDFLIGLELTKNCSSPLSISMAILLRISSHKPTVFLRRSLNCLLDMRWGNLLLCSCNL